MGRTRAQAIEQSGKGTVTSVFDTIESGECTFTIAPDESAIINDPQIDAVFVCTPNHRIVPLCKQALAAGKHVFSENHLHSMQPKWRRFVLWKRPAAKS